MQLTPGANAALSGLSQIATITWDHQPGSADIDISAYLLGENGKTSSDADMIFYGQPNGPGVALTIDQTARQARLTLDLAAVPANAARIAICAVIDTASNPAARLADAGVLRFANDQHDFAVDLAARTEQALILAEFYRRGAEWKLRCVAQGFNGGLAPLARSFGIEVADEPAPAAAAPNFTPPVSLAKKLVTLEKRDPSLVSLVKKVGVSLEKSRLAVPRARVALCLDISGSMDKLYRTGKIDALVRRILALGLNFDDDGAIDVFLFGTQAHAYGEVTIDNYRTFTADMQRRHSLEGGTNYGKVMGLMREHYARQPNAASTPVYIMFVTDGGTQDTRRSETEIIAASREPLFWQFMAIGQMPKTTGIFGGRRRLPHGFDFLAYLDKMEGRAVDNANFFAVTDPDEPSDDELFDLLMAEYPAWQTAAITAGILRR